MVTNLCAHLLVVLFYTTFEGTNMDTLQDNLGQAMNARKHEDVDGFKTASNCRYPWFCVGVRIGDNKIEVRDTKDPDKKTLSFTPDEWKSFLTGVKSGEFDLS